MKKITLGAGIFLLGVAAIPQQTKKSKPVDYLVQDSSITKIRARIELIKLNIE